MSLDDHKTAVHRFVAEVVNRGDLGGVESLVHPEYRERSYPHQTVGPAAVREWFPYLHRVFPNIECRVEDMVAEGDLVAWRAVQTGTQEHYFLGEKPTGRRATWLETHFVRFSDGLMVEHWGPFSRKAPDTP